MSALYEPVLDHVVMSNKVHVYVSQADKGELVMGAGMTHTTATRSGARSTIEHQLAAAVELFLVFAHAQLLRTWGGIVDACLDASPILGPSGIDGLFLNCGWGPAGSRRRRARPWAYAETIANGEPSELARPFSLDRSPRVPIDEHGAAAVAHRDAQGHGPPPGARPPGHGRTGDLGHADVPRARRSS